MGIDNLLARLTAQSNGPNPKEPGGGKPEFTASDISLIASHAPKMSFHALMVKCCHDQISLRILQAWLHDTSLTEWFLNPENMHATVHVGQVNRLVDLAIIGWANPASKEAASIESRARYIKTGFDTFKRKYQTHYNYLDGELHYLEAVGRKAINGFNQRNS